MKLNRVVEEIGQSVRLHHAVSLVPGALYGDTGESGETYDAEAKAESWVGSTPRLN